MRETEGDRELERASLKIYAGEHVWAHVQTPACAFDGYVFFDGYKVYVEVRGTNRDRWERDRYGLINVDKVRKILEWVDATDDDCVLLFPIIGGGVLYAHDLWRDPHYDVIELPNAENPQINDRVYKIPEHQMYKIWERRK